MTFNVKVLLGLVSTAGSCCAIAVPVSMSSKKGVSRTRRESESDFYPVSSVQRSSPSALVNLERCPESESSTGNKVILGEKEGGFCWKAEGWTDNLSMSGEYTTLFKDEWGQGGRVWGAGVSDKWKSTCQDTHSDWQIWGSGNGEQYLGLCGEKKVEETPFVKKKSEGNSANIWICSSGCWESGTLRGTIQAQTSLQQERSEGWKKVEFFKNS